MNRPIRYNQLVQLLLAHARQIFREPAVLFWGIVFPILMSIGLGIALMFSPALAAGDAEKGKDLFSDPKFGGGTAGVSCNSCPASGRRSPPGT